VKRVRGLFQGLPNF